MKTLTDYLICAILGLATAGILSADVLPPVWNDVKPKAIVKQPTHSHKCWKCGTIWSHSDDSFGKIEDHRCPKPGCGAIQWNEHQRFIPKSVKPAKGFVSPNFCPT